MTGEIRITDTAQIAGVLSDLTAMLGYTQRGLATEAGFRQGQLWTWLSGSTVPETRSLLQLLQTLGYDLALIPREDA